MVREFPRLDQEPRVLARDLTRDEPAPVEDAGLPRGDVVVVVGLDPRHLVHLVVR